MIITLAGTNSFLLQEELKSLVATFIAEHGDLALERVDGEEAEFQNIQQALTSLPFLSTKKMVLLRSPSNNKMFVEKVEQLVSQIPDTTEVIIVEPKLDKRSSYYKFLKRDTDFRDYSELDQESLIRWLVSKANERGGALSSADARYLVERIGVHHQQLSTELEKLLLYEPKISRSTIELLTEATPQSTIFQLLESAFAKNPKRVMQLYKEQRTLKVEPPQIIAMLVWQLHILALIKSAGERSSEQIAKDAKLNPYVVNKSSGIARKLSLSTLKKLLADLQAIDSRSKREPIDSDEALQLYLLNVSL
jgi:DNA polymerase-3 subunit delta